MCLLNFSFQVVLKVGWFDLVSSPGDTVCFSSMWHIQGHLRVASTFPLPFGQLLPSEHAWKVTITPLVCYVTLNQQSWNAKPRQLLPSRHGPEVPKFVFIAVAWGFEPYGHASRMAQLTTFSVESPPTYIPLKLLVKKLNLSPSQQDPNWPGARHLKMPPRWFEQWQGFWPPCRTFFCCVIRNPTHRTISVRFI